jgi:hypothetical protein
LNGPTKSGALFGAREALDAVVETLASTLSASARRRFIAKLPASARPFIEAMLDASNKEPAAS